MTTTYIPYPGPPNGGIWEVGQTATDINGVQWLCQGRGVAGQPNTLFLQIAEPPSIGPDVNSVFGRTGVVTATTGDYTAAQVTNAPDLSSVSTQLFAGPLAAPSASVSGAVTATSVAGGAITGSSTAVTGALTGSSASVSGALASSSAAISGAITGTTIAASSAITGTSASVNHAVSAVNLITAPAASSSVAVTLGTPIQNTLGYDSLLIVFVKITAATSATILAGVSPSSSPPTNPYVSTDSLTGVVPISLYVPNNYYAVVTTSGTITATATGMWCPV